MLLIFARLTTTATPSNNTHWLHLIRGTLLVGLVLQDFKPNQHGGLFGNFHLYVFYFRDSCAHVFAETFLHHNILDQVVADHVPS